MSPAQNPHGVQACDVWRDVGISRLPNVWRPFPSYFLEGPRFFPTCTLHHNGKQKGGLGSNRVPSCVRLGRGWCRQARPQRKARGRPAFSSSCSAMSRSIGDRFMDFSVPSSEEPQPAVAWRSGVSGLCAGMRVYLRLFACGLSLYVFVRVRIRVFVCIFVYVFVCIFAYWCMCLCICICVSMCVFVLVHM